MDNVLKESYELNVKIPEIVVDEKDPFLNDKLERDEDIKTMTRIVETFGRGAVVSLNAPWGDGKTTFLKLWKQYLENKDFKVVFYNAWKDDLGEEPLFSMIKCLRNLSKDQSGFDKFVEKAGKFIVGGLFGALKAVSGFWGDVAKGAIKGGVDQLEKDCIESLKNKDDTATLISTFKDALQEYVSFACSEKVPLIFFVDELDRCNPTFAVKTLERIKHLFDIDNIVFVLSIDKVQLCHSINGYFGSESFDSEEYLMRFIDIEYMLPSFTADNYCAHLFEHYYLTKVLKEEDAKNLLIVSGHCCATFGFTCRQIEKAFSLFMVAYFCVDRWPYQSQTINDFHIELLFYLAALKVRNPDLFANIAEGFISEQELVDEIEKLYKECYNYKMGGLEKEEFIDVVSLLLVYYNEHRWDRYNWDNSREFINEDNGIDNVKFGLFSSAVMDKAICKFKKVYEGDPLSFYVEKLRLINTYEKMHMIIRCLEFSPFDDRFPMPTSLIEKNKVNAKS